MPRDQGVRNRIVEYLAQHGAVEDSSGKATAVLKQAIAYEGTDAGFTQVVAAMAKAGMLDRRIKGKRTYRIASAGNARANGATPSAVNAALSLGSNGTVPDNGSLDYDELAAVLLAHVGACGQRARRWRGFHIVGPPTTRAARSPQHDVATRTSRGRTGRPKRSWRSATRCATSSRRHSTISSSSRTVSRSPSVRTDAPPTAWVPTSRHCSINFVTAASRVARGRPSGPADPSRPSPTTATALPPGSVELDRRRETSSGVRLTGF